VIPEVHLPQNLSDEAKEAFEKFIALAPQENPREDLLKKVR
jgi:chaperone protein dnaJ 1